MEFKAYYPNKTPNGVILEKNLYLEMRDGIKLAMDVYKPAIGKGPWPVILGMAPYPKEVLFETANIGYFTSKGYIVVNLQTRGSGMSQGKYEFFCEAEINDGYDIVEGLAAQEWCDGNVGMFGASYLTINQWHTAALNPPHLKCILPYAGLTDFYRNAFYPGGLHWKGFIEAWWGLNVKRILWPWPGVVPGKLEPRDFSADAFMHHVDGPYYWGISPLKKIDKIKVPVMSVVPANHGQRLSQLKSWNDIKSPKRLLVVPGEGLFLDFMNSNLGINEMCIRWFDQWLKGIDTGIMDEPEVAIYDNGTGEWRYENEYPLKRTKWTKFYLHESSVGAPKLINVGSLHGLRDAVEVENTNMINDDSNPYGILSKNPPQEEEVCGKFVVHSTNLYGEATTESIVYSSGSLKEDLPVRGPLSLTIYGSVEAPLTCTWAWFAKLGFIDTNGNTKLLTDGCLKASFREIDKANSKPGQPWRLFEEQVDLEPNKVYEFEIEFMPIFYTFKKGYEIYIQIAGQDPQYLNNNSVDPVVTGASPIASRVTVYHTPKYPSHLLLPVIPDALEIAKVGSPLADAIPTGPKVSNTTNHIGEEQIKSQLKDM